MVPNAKQIVQNLPLYTGDATCDSRPYLLRCNCLFLVCAGIIIVKGDEKWWILAISVLAIALSMGRNFMWLTDLFFTTSRCIHKFRSVTFS
jgi:hypothetical protein